MTSPRRALIVGAGIGGLATAVALRRAGWQVRVFERAAAARDPGFGLVLAPNAMAALRELGLAETLVSTGVAAGDAEVRRTDGRVLRRFQASADPEAHRWSSVVILRSALHGALLAAVGSDVVECGSDAVGFHSTEGGVSVQFANGRTDTGDILIGADGVGSVIRKRLHTSEPPPRPSRFCALRGVAYDVQANLADLTVVGFLGPGIEAATLRASERAVYWYLSMLTDDLPSHRLEPIRILEQRTGRFDARFRAITEATHAEDLRFDQLFERPPLDTWGVGRVTLLGDAAHPMLPHTGQGAAQALEDAVALGLALERATEPSAALRRYETVRAARTRRVIKLGPRLARVSTTHNRLVSGLRNAGVRLVPDALLTMGLRRMARDPHRKLRTGTEPAA